MGPAGISEKSIAVLPLENLTEEKENASFADGIQDELLSNLAKIKDLKVISRTSVMRSWSGITRNLKEVAQQLGVSKVVEGSVRRSGNRLRVSVQLIDALTDRHIWSENYDRTLADSLALQGRAGHGDRGERGRDAESAGEGAGDGQAHEQSCCLRCLSAWPAAICQAARNQEGAIRSFQEAVKLDPNFALAWAHLSSAQSLSYWVGTRSKPRAAGGS